MNIFEEENSALAERLKKEKTLSFFVSLFTFGLANRNKNIAILEEKINSNNLQKTKYDELITRASNLDKLAQETFTIQNVRVSSLTFADFSSSQSPGYPVNWAELRVEILERDNFTCQEYNGHCSGPLQIHHRTPLSQGGTNKHSNLITLCYYHHCLKHDHMKVQFNGNFRG